MHWRHERLPASERTLLPYGNGRSYGDSCLNDGGDLIAMRGLDRFIHFDPSRGTLACEAGVLLSEILELIVPQGWFLPVTPGTQFVTLGGAIANDVHGKNHHRAGTLGCHVRRFELLRSDGSRLLCTPQENADWFGATIGGLGLTGVIVWAEIDLQRIRGPLMDLETLRMTGLKDFFDISAASDTDYAYTVAWVDCSVRGRRLGRGLFMRANHAAATDSRNRPGKGSLASIPFTPPVSLVNRFTLRPFNAFYYHRQRKDRVRSLAHYQSFFYPLDSLRDWNRLYGPTGFMQYQCVVPRQDGDIVISELLQRIAAAETGSMLSVLKVFGDRPSPGWLSFPRPGITLALDFPNQGQPTLRLLDELEALVSEAQGAVYPAKDARMSPGRFRQYFPHWTRLREYVDPAFSSGLWRRVSEETS